MTLRDVANPQPVPRRALVTLDEIRESLAVIAREVLLLKEAFARFPQGPPRPQPPPTPSSPIPRAGRDRDLDPKSCPICARVFKPTRKPDGRPTDTCSRLCGARLRARRQRGEA